MNRDYVTINYFLPVSLSEKSYGTYTVQVIKLKIPQLINHIIDIKII